MHIGGVIWQAIAFDPLEYTHELEASGVPREQAEVQANMDMRFAEMKTRTDSEFMEMESSLGKRFAQVDVRFERMEGRFLLMYWMQGLTMACVVIPVIRDFLA